jgi:predicted anti-sigma-YlaC factor YlaD
MRCQEAYEALSARMDGELEAAEGPRLAAHLAGCASCRAQEEELLLLGRRLRGAAAEQTELSPFAVQRITHLVSPPAPRRVPFVFGLAFLGATASLAAAALVARARPAEPAGVVAGQAEAACQIAGGTSPLSGACATGGLAGAKLAMQDVVKRAQARGLKFECRTCHRNDTRYDLRENARVWLSQLLPSPT